MGNVHVTSIVTSDMAFCDIVDGDKGGVGKMTDSPFDINANLQGKARKLELLVESLRDTEIIELCECAEASYIDRLRRCVDRLDEAVLVLESSQGGR